jgi:hypothetical protein
MSNGLLNPDSFPTRFLESTPIPIVGLEGTVSLDGFFSRYKRFNQYTCGVCADGVQGLFISFSLPCTIIKFLFASLKLPYLPPVLVLKMKTVYSWHHYTYKGKNEGENFCSSRKTAHGIFFFVCRSTSPTGRVSWTATSPTGWTTCESSAAPPSCSSSYSPSSAWIGSLG